MKYSINVNEVLGNDGNIRGFATVVFGDSFKITNIAIMENTQKGELFVSMPRYKSKGVDQDNNPVYRDICHPITKEFREELYANILEEYQNIKSKKKEQVVGEPDAPEMPEFSIRVTPVAGEGANLRGLASIYFEDSFIVNNVTILQGKENLFVAMPSYKTKKMDDNEKPIYQDVCYPITKEFREKLYGALISECEKKLEEMKEINPVTGKPYNRRERIQKEEQTKEEQAQAEKKTDKKPNGTKKAK